jgi:cytoskeletal protein CcmA (bactofilin family)
MFDSPETAVYLRATISIEVDTSFRYRRFIMALWKVQFGRDQSGPEPAAKAPEKVSTLAAVGDPPVRAVATQNRADASAKESIIAAGLTIEGKIEGAGHVRIAGDFKGDVNVQGNLTIEAGAHLTGGVKADTVIVGGQLDGNIDAASRVELLQTGVLNGELKAGSLVVAAGSRMRGKAEFGWDEKPKH